LALLNHMRQFMRQQPVAARGVRPERARPEHDVPPGRQRPRAKTRRNAVGCVSCVHPDRRKVRRKGALHRCLRARRQGSAATGSGTLQVTLNPGQLIVRRTVARGADTAPLHPNGPDNTRAPGTVTLRLHLIAVPGNPGGVECSPSCERGMLAEAPHDFPSTWAEVG
jgi:hypothetical protein